MENEEKTRIQPKIFILFVVIGLLPMVVGSVILLSGARQTYQDVIGGHLSVVAENAQMELLGAYFRRVTAELNNVALASDVRNAVEQSNLKGADANTQALILEWAKGEAESNGLVRSVLENAASQYLREYSLDGDLRQIVVTDRRGRVVAATNWENPYYQSGNRWWRYAFREGAGGRYIGNIVYDEKTDLYTMDFALPIVERASQRTVGVIKAAVDAEEVINLVKSVKVGERGHAMLVRGDAVILASPEVTLKDQSRFRFFKDMRSAMDAGQRSIVVGEGDERSFIGLPPFRIRDTLPELDWYLVVIQPRSEALALFSNINTKFFYILIFSVLVVVAMSIFFSWVLVKPVIETDPHLDKL
jgi:hypothetical protein